MARAVAPSAAWRNRIIRSGAAALSEIAPNPGNWRTHPRLQADALSAVLADVGYVQQVIINARSGRLVDGHLRVELAAAHGESSVPAVWVDLSDDEERLVLATLDPIGALAETNRDALGALLGDLTERADALGAMLDGLAKGAGLDGRGSTTEDPGPQIDRAEELRQKWGTDTGQVWEIGRHRLLCGDSTSAEDVARLMGGTAARLCFMSPPYNGATHIYLTARRQNRTLYEDNDRDDMTESDYLALVQGAIRRATDAVSDGFVCVNLGYNANSRGSYVKAIAPFADLLWETVIWKKHGTPVSNGFTRDCEFVFCLGIGDHGHVNEPFATERHCWEIPSLGASDWETHRAAFPVALPTRAITLLTRAGQGVIDLFLGTGTTLVAAEQTGRIGYGMEIEPKYVAVALERLAGMGLEPRRL